MDRKPLKTVRLRAGLGCALALAAAACLAPLSRVSGGDAKPGAPAKDQAAKEQKPEKKVLSGADLYAIHCNRCHPERYATEWTSAQWKTVLLHMRVRANLPASQAKIILKFLQEDAGS